MTEKQTTFSPVEDLEDTLVSPFLMVDEVKNGDKVKLIKKSDRPIIWTESVDFSKEGEQSKETKIYKCMGLFKDREVEIKLNGLSRKTIFAKFGNKTEQLADKTGIIAVVEKGVYSHFFICAIE